MVAAGQELLLDFGDNVATLSLPPCKHSAECLTARQRGINREGIRKEEVCV